MYGRSISRNRSRAHELFSRQGSGSELAVSGAAVPLAAALALALALPACKDQVDLGEATVEHGWLRGDLHGHTTHSDGFDGIATKLAIADAWRAPEWLERNPGFEEDHLHFYAVTDHRTMSGCHDPDFTHDYLIPMCGTEWGGPLHACVWGVSEEISHRPQGDETELERLADSIKEAHAQGALFSLAHPLDSRLWSVPVEGFDAIEVWNAMWTISRGESTIEQLEARVERYGGENPAVRAAVEHTGGGNNAQALRFWQAWLSAGVHVPPVGGGDRHFVFPAGFPTTYVKAPSRDVDGILTGIRAGETFISRSPQGPQVLLEAQVDGTRYPMGSALPAGTGEVLVHWRVMRAEGGLLRLVQGVVDPSLPDPVETVIELAGADESGTFTWRPAAEGGWLHAVVVDPLPADVPETFAPFAASVTTFQEAEAGDRAGSVAGLLADLAVALDFDAIMNPKLCDTSRWEPWVAWCMPAAMEELGSIYLTLELQPFFSVEFRDKEATGYAMGAISAAFFVP